MAPLSLLPVVNVRLYNTPSAYATFELLHSGVSALEHAGVHCDVDVGVMCIHMAII